MYDLRIASFMLLFICQLLANAQTRVMRIPNQYRLPFENTKTNATSTDFSFLPWVVFSDRSENTTYTTEDGNSVSKVLSFMESFYVLDESDNRLHIAKVADGEMIKSELTVSKYDDFGWIEKENMLLWHQGTTAQSTGVKRKVIVINNMEWAAKLDVNDQSDVVHLYKKPDLTLATGLSAQTSQIFYVYKVSPDKRSLLIGRTSKITDFRNAENEVVGWGNRLRFIFWDHCVAIEPNWLEPAVAERKDKGVKCMVFRDKSSAERYQTSLSFDPATVVWNSDPYEKRRKGDYMRFPFISLDTNNNIAKIGFWGSSFFYDNRKLIDNNIQAEINRKISQAIEKSRNLNFIFVVDGSNRMLQYVNSIADAITSSMKLLSQTKNNIRFGAVVYCDFADGDSRVESKQLTTNYNDVNDWLRKTYSTVNNLKDNDGAKAMFNGLHDALCYLTPNETNYIIIIGEKGNQQQRNVESQLRRSELSTSLSNKNVNLFALQVNHNGSQDFENFNLQVKDLIQASAYISWKQDENKYKLFGINSPPKIDKLGNTVSFLEGDSLAGKLVQSLPGKSISPYTLQKQLISFITKAEDDVNEVIALLNDLRLGKGISPIADNVEYKPALLDILVQSGLSQEQFEMLKKSKLQFYTTGYSVMQLKGFSYPFFQAVIFIDREELSRFVNDISRLLQEKSGNEVRRHLYNTFLKILDEHLGEMGTKNVGQKSMGEITDLLFGLPSTSRFLKDLRLDDILDPVRFPNDKLMFWMSEMETKLNQLKKIQNSDNYVFSFESNDEIFYWLQQSNLP